MQRVRTVVNNSAQRKKKMRNGKVADSSEHNGLTGWLQIAAEQLWLLVAAKPAECSLHMYLGRTFEFGLSHRPSQPSHQAQCLAG